jgi:hypothetical protein
MGGSALERALLQGEDNESNEGEAITQVEQADEVGAERLEQLQEYARTKLNEAKALQEDVIAANHALCTSDTGAASSALDRLRSTVEGAIAQASSLLHTDSDGHNTFQNRSGDDDDTEMIDARLASSNGHAERSASAYESEHDHELAKHSSAFDTDSALEERARWTPLRLTLQERKTLRLVEATLDVSEYAEVVDVVSSKPHSIRATKQLKELCSILCGLVVANDFKAGRELIENRSFVENESFFASAFEVARRHKHLNMELVGQSYAKLLFALMDAEDAQVKSLTELSIVQPITTVSDLCNKHNISSLLKDSRLAEATEEINPRGRNRAKLQRLIKRKERTRSQLASEYAKKAEPQLSKDEVERMLFSINDANAYLTFNADPVERLINLLKSYFDPNSSQQSTGGDLGIVVGKGGSRLTHKHAMQYKYVLQSLTLWTEMLRRMQKLWCLAESDMLNAKNPYSLRDTGQGLNRVQKAPLLGSELRKIVQGVSASLSHEWVGSTFLHLGDDAVPNAFVWLTKVIKIPRMVSPIVGTIDAIDQRIVDEDYCNAVFGGPEAAKIALLNNYFKHAFDGSGDTSAGFAFSGSCIDGRTSSAFQYGQDLPQKRPKLWGLLKLAGHTSFD